MARQRLDSLRMQTQQTLMQSVFQHRTCILKSVILNSLKVKLGQAKDPDAVWTSSPDLECTVRMCACQATHFDNSFGDCTMRQYHEYHNMTPKNGLVWRGFVQRQRPKALKLDTQGSRFQTSACHSSLLTLVMNLASFWNPTFRIL